jgi:hypothetical protein
MPKTKRDLLYAVAAKIGGETGEKLLARLQKKTIIDDILDRPMSDEDFQAQLQKMENGLPSALAKIQGVEWMKSDEWGLN